MSFLSQWYMAPTYFTAEEYKLRYIPSICLQCDVICKYSAQTVSKDIACVLVFSAMPPHPRGQKSFCDFGWDVILYRQSPDAVLEFHDPIDYARYVCTAWKTRNIWCLSVLP